MTAVLAFGFVVGVFLVLAGWVLWQEYHDRRR